jgi:hypothetical protein
MRAFNAGDSKGTAEMYDTNGKNGCIFNIFHLFDVNVNSGYFIPNDHTTNAETISKGYVRRCHKYTGHKLEIKS